MKDLLVKINHLWGNDALCVWWLKYHKAPFLVDFLLLCSMPWLQVTWGEKVLFSLMLPGHSPSLRGVRQKGWRDASYWLIPRLTFSCLSYTCLFRNGTTHGGLSPPTLINNQENAPTHAHGSIWWKKFLSWSFIFLNVLTVKISHHISLPGPSQKTGKGGTTRNCRKGTVLSGQYQGQPTHQEH